MPTTRTMQEIRADYDKLTEDFWSDETQSSVPDAAEKFMELERPLKQELSDWFANN